MKGNMKRSIILMLMLLFAVSAVFAGGDKETTVKNGTTTRSVQNSITADSRLGYLATVMNGVGNTLGKVTAAVTVGLHPFPQALTRFYDFSKLGSSETVMAYSNDFDAASDMLTSIGYTVSLDSSKYFEPETIKTADGQTYTGYRLTLGKSGELVNWVNGQSDRRWPVVAMLFGLLLAAEIVFTAVFGYVMPEQEGQSLLKMIATKIAKALILFVLAASLPFLLEAVRYGLFRVAEMYQDPTIEVDTMFEMPTVFINRMSRLVDTVGWRADAEPVFGGERSVFEKVAFNTLGRLLVSLVYIVFEFVLCIELFKTGLHIAMNIIEVYLLLTVVLLVLPFTIFTPTKSMVQGCVQTLFLNLIECFVIMLIIILVLPACERAMDALYGLMTGSGSVVARVSLESEMEVEQFKDASGVKINFRYDFVTREQAIAMACSYSYVDDNGAAHDGGLFSCVWDNTNPATGAQLSNDQKQVAASLAETWVEKCPKNLASDATFGGKDLGSTTTSEWKDGDYSASGAGYRYIDWDRLEGSNSESGNETLGSKKYVTNISKRDMKSYEVEAFCQEVSKNILIRARRSLVGGTAWKSDWSQFWEGALVWLEGGVLVVVGGAVCVIAWPASLSAITVGAVVGVTAGAAAVAGGTYMSYSGAGQAADAVGEKISNLLGDLKTQGNTTLIQGTMEGSSRTIWRNAMMKELREQASLIMMNEQASETAETSVSNESVIGDMIIAWILVMLPCYFIKQSSQITNGLRSGYVGFESFANSTSHALQSMARGMGMMVSLASKGVGMIGKGVEQKNQADANRNYATIAENMRKGEAKANEH